MPSRHAIFESAIPSLKLLARGKVRDVYEVGAEHLLFVTSDRISAFDVVFPTPIPGKGIILNQMSNFWFAKFSDLIPNHLTQLSAETVVQPEEVPQVQGRAVVARRLRPVPVEAVVRGYIEGSGWKEYQHTQSICGIALPAGLQRAEQLPEPLFTPSTKAEVGTHDENISFDDMVKQVGGDLAERVRVASLALYTTAAEFARSRGIIIADTKFEFGLDDTGELVLMDEVLTPDSSRFWPIEHYRVGTSPESFDKQYLRNWLESTGWNKSPPAPSLPPEVTQQTLKRYEDALHKLTTNQGHH